MDGIWPVEGAHEAGLRVHDHNVTITEVVDFSHGMHDRQRKRVDDCVLSCAREGVMIPRNPCTSCALRSSSGPTRILSDRFSPGTGRLTTFPTTAEWRNATVPRRWLVACRHPISHIVDTPVTNPGEQDTVDLSVTRPIRPKRCFMISMFLWQNALLGRWPNRSP